MENKCFDAVVFDLDGVITKTALTHSAAWKKVFDDFLRQYSIEKGIEFKEFTHKDDYLPYVDGKPRYKGVADFLQSRGIHMPFGDPSDQAGTSTVCALGNMKNDAFNEVLRRDGVEVYPSTVALMQQLRQHGYRVGVASSSKNCEAVLEAATVSHLVETRVDGVVSAALGLKGKPEADIFTTATDNLGCVPYRTIVVEDAVSGVQAGQKGNFGLVIGIAREKNHQELLTNGADIVVDDLEDFGIAEMKDWFENQLEKEEWAIKYHNYDSKNERSREALLAVGNGYFATRGAMEETRANPANYPGTYMAGMYNRLITNVAGRDIENEDFVNLPNWLPVSFAIDNGDWLDSNKTTIRSIKRRLCLRSGVLKRDLVVEDEKGRQTKIVSERFAAMHDPMLGAMRYTVQALNYQGRLRLRSGIDGNISNAGVERYKSLNQQHIKPIQSGSEDDILFLLSQTTQSGHMICEAVRHSVWLDGEPYGTAGLIEAASGEIWQTYELDIKQGQSISLEKILAICSDKENFIEDALSSALAAHKTAHSFNTLLLAGKQQWEQLWAKFDIRIAGDRMAQKLIRLHIYHLLVAMSPHNTHLDASITARGLHGEAYRGHIFWDELFILPLYSLHLPEVTKSMLMYRYRRLEQARENAKELGYQGAMYPWQSGSTGREETQIVHLNPLTGEWGDDHSSLQRHVSLAIAYNIWDYYWISNDQDFLNRFGLPMFFEICRFWAGKARQNPTTGRYEIDGVMGPDEFHEHMPGTTAGGLKDNTYTNLMVAWMFGKAEEIAKISGEKCLQNAGFSPEELKLWQQIASKLNLVINNEGILAQYDGYFSLKELDWEFYRKKYGNVYRMDRILKAEGKSPDDFKVAKQADTLMTFYNLDKNEVDGLLEKLNYRLPDDYLEKNLNYYLKRTSHGSTLSRVVHSRLAAMVGDKKLSLELYNDALSSDYIDIQGGTTGEGIHAGVMAGTILIALNTFAGIGFRNQIVSLNPDLPEKWEKMTFALTFKGVNFNFELSKSKCRARADKDVSITFKGNTNELRKDTWIELA